MSQPDVAGGSLHRQDVHYENDRKAIMEISTADAGQIAPHATPCAKQPPAPFLSTNNARSATRGGKPSFGEMSLSSASAQQVPNAPQRTASAHRFHRSSVDRTHLRKANMEKCRTTVDSYEKAAAQQIEGKERAHAHLVQAASAWLGS